jgi:hypothetical protein
LKAKCPNLVKEKVNLELEGIILVKAISQLHMEPRSSCCFDRDSFIGKMKTFFPSFFNSLSNNDISALIKHEDWIVEIFCGFWELVMKKFENPSFGDQLIVKDKGNLTPEIPDLNRVSHKDVSYGEETCHQDFGEVLGLFSSKCFFGSDERTLDGSSP